MAINPDEDTEFNDALRKHGIIPAKIEQPPTPSPPASPTLAAVLESAGGVQIDELDELLDDVGVDSDEERLIDSYRRQRIAEMSKEAKASRRFGQVLPIGREDYTREVTEASKAPEPDEHEKDPEDPLRGTGVVCFLYQDGEPASVKLAGQLRTLAVKHPRTKFVSIVGSKCIENYPDRHLPTLFLYRNGSLRRQFVAYGKDRDRAVEELEVLLMATNLIDPLKAQLSDRPPPSSAQNDDDGEDDDDDENPVRNALRSPAQRNQTGTGGVNHRTTNIRSGTVGQDDSDSDYDL